MKKPLITLILTLIYIISFGQLSDSNKNNNILVGLSFSPDYCFRSLKTEPSEKWIADLRDSLEIPKFGFTTGIDLLFKFNQSIAIEAGIYFSDKGEQTIVMELIPIEPDPTLPDKAQIKYHYFYIDIPIKANYFVLKRDLKLFISIGVSTNIFLTQKRVAKQFNPDDKHTHFESEDFSRFNFAVVGGAGLDYKFSNRFNLRIEPIFRYSLTPIMDAPIKQYHYSIGANFGIYYKLK